MTRQQQGARQGGSFASDYNEVADRIREFREKYPNGRLRPVDPTNPYKIETVGDKTFIVYTAEAYRDPEDSLPGIGVAWEPFPGQTNFTRNSELQNAETSAWGRAMVAALVADTKKGIATADEVRNRSAEQEPDRRPEAVTDQKWLADFTKRVEMCPDHTHGRKLNRELQQHIADRTISIDDVKRLQTLMQERAKEITEAGAA